MNPNSIYEASRTRILSALAVSTLLLAGLLAFGAQSALAGSGGVGTTPGTGSGSTSSDGNANLTPSKYSTLWERVSGADKRWARGVSECESGHDPNAVAMGGDYRGAFMFTPDAWRTSPKTPGGDPIDYSYKTQAVVAVALKKRDGTAPWPVCG